MAVRRMPVAEQASLIRARRLCKVFQTPAGPFDALKGIDFEVHAGEFVAVIGKSGSGKSTLINMITGIDRPSAGEVWVGPTAVHGLSENELALWRGRNVGIVFQFFQLLPTLTLAENVILAMELNGLYGKGERRQRALHLLGLVGLAEQADKLPSAVSGGQQQRAAIARALANDPPLLVADEPTGNLDSRTSEQIFQLFERLVAEGKTIIIVTHDDEQARRVQRTLLLADGEIVNEHLMRALATLSPERLVEIGRQARQQRYAPGVFLIRQGSAVQAFHIITEGAAEVLIRHPDGHSILVDRLEAGQYFGEQSIFGGMAAASVRAAADAGLATVSLAGPELSQLLADSPALRQELAEIVNLRLLEARLSALTALDSDRLAAITDDAAVTEYTPGQHVVTQGEWGNTFFVILQGAAEVVYQSPDGAQATVDRLESGAYFGELALLGNGRRTATVRAAADSVLRVATLTRADLARLMGDSQEFKARVGQTAAERQAELDELSGQEAAE